MKTEESRPILICGPFCLVDFRLSQDEVRAKVELYRTKLMDHGTMELPKDEFGRLL